MIKAVLFDFFDVLRTDGSNRWLKQHGLDREGPFLAESQRHDRGEYTDKQYFEAVGKLSGQTGDQVEQEMEDNNVLNQSLVDYISTLHGTYKLALLSNSASKYLRDELAKYDLEKYFDEIVISSEVGLIKPEPAIFEHILKKLALRPDECVFTDDNPKNVEAAEKLGIHGIVFTGTDDFRQRFEKYLTTT